MCFSCILFLSCCATLHSQRCVGRMSLQFFTVYRYFNQTFVGYILPNCAESTIDSQATTGLTTFLGFLESWKCQGIRQWLGKSKEEGPKSGKGQGICIVREIRLWQLNKMLITKLWRELCSVHGHVLRSSYNLPVLCSYCDSFFIRDVRREFGLINVHLFNILPAISPR